MSSVSMPTEVVYPDSDGQPMAENTLQYEWIVTIKGNLDRICVGDRAALVAGDNLIYPVEGVPGVCKAPDVYVALGRPRGHRGSYRVWEEGGVFPQVIFEIRSPGNSERDLVERRRFYRRYGAEEYVVYNPHERVLDIHVRDGNRLVPVDDVDGWVSPLLGIKFDMSGDDLVIFAPDGKRFLTFEELAQENDELTQENKELSQDNTRLRAKLRAAGLDPNAP